MKKPTFVILVFVLNFCLNTYSQQVQIISGNEQRNAYEGKSYLIIGGSLTLGNGFTAKAATTGAWYAKTEPSSNAPTNLSANQNFVRTESILRSGVTTEAQVIGLSTADKATSFVYMDGVGRTLQSVDVAQSPGQKDVIAPSFYDTYGRPTRQYLPYTASGTAGTYRPNALTDQNAFYNTPPEKVQGDSRPYSEMVYDNLPAGQIAQATAVGVAWATKPNISSFKLNDVGTVQLWQVVGNLPVSTTTWLANTLTISESQNEEGTITRKYTDFLGRVILTETQAPGGLWAKTYTVYNEYGKPLFIIPPAAITNLNPDQAYADRWFFQYQYDNYQRTISSKTPGAAWVYTIYDQWDRPVLSQDGNQRDKALPEWNFIKYDDLNRPIIDGVLKTTDTRVTLTAALSTFAGRYETRNTSSVGYTLNQTFPTTVTEADLLSISYFDGYTHLSNANWDAQNKSFAFVRETGFTGNVFTVVPPGLPPDPDFPTLGTIKNLSTGGKVRILNSNTWLNSVIYYDNRYRALQTISENQYEQLDRSTNEYDFVGRVLKTKRVYNTPATPSLAITQRNVYDPIGRPLNTYHQINSQPEILLSSFVYNELGQIIDKKIHSTDNGASYLQSLDLRYNIRGWNTNINNVPPDAGDPADYFGLELAFNNSQSGNTTRFDGQITGAKWKHDLSAKDRVYNFTYDKGSLTSANYKVDNTVNTQTGVFDETGITYDLNGNIQTLSRKAGLLTSSTVDQLTYNYGANGGNQLMKVTDAQANSQGFNDGNTTGDDYVYDVNGNLTQDKNKGINSITYNFQNLPDRIAFSDNTYLVYTYDAGGTKLRQTYFSAANVPLIKSDYVGELMLLNDQLQLINHELGRALPADYSNLIPNPTREGGSLEGYPASGNVALTSETIGSQTYIKAVSNQAGGTPGVVPIGSAIAVKPGESYQFTILGYQSAGTNANLYVWGSSGDIIWPGAALPLGSANEAITSANFVVPVGVTQINLGVIWNSPSNGDTFYINRVALYKTDFEYQYFLTDQVGSPRVVLQTSPTTNTYTATMEPKNYNNPSASNLGESGQFLNLVSGREISLALANATPGGGHAYLLNASARIGPGRSFRVLPGDKIDARVMAYYPAGGTHTKTPFASMATFVATALSGGLAGAIDGVTAASYAASSTGTNASFLLSQSQGSTKPSAFINYILFDETYTPIEAKSAPVGDNAGVLHAVVLPQISVNQTGYLYVYLSYDNEAGGAEVYFDDFKITYTESPVIQVNSYYPYGLTSFSWVREGESENKFLFQGKEQITQTGWQDFGARMYDGATGRWFVVDPAGQFFSPYLGMGNNPIFGIDPDGRFWHIVIGGAIGGVFNWISNGAQFNAEGLKYFGVGAVAGALSAGIGAGVNVAMAGGSFGAGFAGTATGVASTGFLSGAATGAAAGFSNGFVSGTGNSLIAGNSIGSSLESGLKTGGIQGLIGGVTGGIGGGLDARSKDLNFWNGKTQLDLSQGIGAHGITGSENSTITGRYVGKYEKVSVYESSNLGQGEYSSGITLPGRGIVVGNGAYSRRLAMDLMQHEYGHILQAEEVGLKAFYSVIGKESLVSASMNGRFGHLHRNYWTETWANYLSSNYFGSQYLARSYFPIQNISTFNLIRLKIASWPF
jgi:RHS repeat-associated protein